MLKFLGRLFGAADRVESARSWLGGAHGRSAGYLAN
jgi:hypothetical protein